MTTETKPFDIDALPYYVVEKSDTHRVLEARFWNPQGKQIAIVASLTKIGDKGDWSAYIGTDAPDSYREHDTCLWAAKYGAKLSESDARYFFPAIKLPYRA